LNHNHNHRYQDLQVNDLFVRNFCAQVSVLFDHLRGVFLSKAVDLILAELLDQLVMRLERTIVMGGKKKFSLFGGLQLDQDVRQLINFFLGLTETIPVRHKFQRLTQVAALLSLDDVDELRDFFDQQKWNWTHREIHGILTLRFRPDIIDREVGYLLR
jgi:conserved oligomeric Golgi complex subunit 4